MRLSASVRLKDFSLNLWFGVCASSPLEADAEGEEDERAKKSSFRLNVEIVSADEMQLFTLK